MSISFIIYVTEECHIHIGHVKLETFKVKVKVLTQNNVRPDGRGKKEQQSTNSSAQEQIKKSLAEFCNKYADYDLS